MQLDLEQLRTLKAVVEHGTLDAAASALHVTPSAISQRLKALETDRRPGPARAQPARAARRRPARRCCGSPARSSCSPPTRPPSWPATRRRRGSGSPSTPTRWRRGSCPRSRRWRARSPSSATARTRSTPRGCSRAAWSSPRSPSSPSPSRAARSRGSARCATGRWPRPRSRSAGSPTARRARRSPTAPMMVFDRDDSLQHDFLAAHARGATPPQTMVPSSTDFVRAIGLGLGWGMVADLQRPDGPELVELEPGAERDVAAVPAALAPAHGEPRPPRRGDRRRRARAPSPVTRVG